jgi:hypothetical protein
MGAFMGERNLNSKKVSKRIGPFLRPDPPKKLLTDLGTFSTIKNLKSAPKA